LHTQLDSNRVLTNWNELMNTVTPDSTDEITAIISSTLQEQTVYYGTMRGKLYRLRNARSNSSVPEAIRGTNFPPGYINCITQHPADSNKLFAVFTNYGILSVYFTDNGGTSWTPVSGNLEQQVNGAGNGPSCRWLTVALVGDSSIYFLGTSIGLYATKKLDGMNTTWGKQSGDRIGNNVVMMMDFRQADGKLAVATYGAGVFTTNINGLDPASGIAETLTERVSVSPNPFVSVLRIEAPGLLLSHYAIYDMGGRLHQSGNLRGGENSIDGGLLSRGNYVLVLRAGDKRIAKKIVKN
jgi:hypothetical protein